MAYESDNIELLTYMRQCVVDTDASGGAWNQKLFRRAIAAIERLEAERAEMLEALRGVVAVADRKTDEFDRARVIIASATADR